MPTTAILQGALTVIVEIAPGKEEPLTKLLMGIGDSVDRLGCLIDFRKLTTVHFMRWVVLPEVKDDHGNTIYPPQLVLSTNYDLPRENHLRELVEVGGEEMKKIYSHCVGYQPGEDLYAYLTRGKFNYTPSAFYVGAVGLSVEMIAREKELREAIEGFVDQRPQPAQPSSDPAQRAMDGKSLRASIQAFVLSRDDLRWASVPEDMSWWNLKYYASAILLILILILMVVGFLTAGVFLATCTLLQLLIRAHESALHEAEIVSGIVAAAVLSSIVMWCLRQGTLRLLLLLPAVACLAAYGLLLKTFSVSWGILLAAEVAAVAGLWLIVAGYLLAPRLWPVALLAVCALLLWPISVSWGVLLAARIVVVAGLSLIAIGFLWWRKLRADEEKEAGDPVKTNRERIDVLVQREDKLVQNQLTHLAFVKPGWLRLTTLRLVLAVINLVARFSVKGDLGGIPTIHFARWVIIDGGKRLLFFSNYDGSWVNYLGDFIDKAADGLTAIWSNTVGCPQAHGLYRGGATDEQRFKSWTRDHQIVTQVWYSAYEQLTVDNINNTHRLRIGLFANLTAAEEREWLSLL